METIGCGLLYPRSGKSFAVCDVMKSGGGLPSFCEGKTVEKSHEGAWHQSHDVANFIGIFYLNVCFKNGLSVPFNFCKAPFLDLTA